MIHMRQNYQSTMVWRNRKWLTQKINFPIDFTRIQKISRTKDEEIKFNFFLNIVSKDKCAEQNGYCYRLSNDEGLSIKCNTKIIYMSRLDMLPKNPTTMKTYMTQASKCLLKTGKGVAFIRVTTHYIALLPYLMAKIFYLRYVLSYELYWKYRCSYGWDWYERNSRESNWWGT